MKQHFSDQTKKNSLDRNFKDSYFVSSEFHTNSPRNVSVYLALGNQTLSQELMNWTR